MIRGIHRPAPRKPRRPLVLTCLEAVVAEREPVDTAALAKVYLMGSRR